MELRKVKLSEIHPYENNPRINASAVEAVAESIRQCGNNSPIVVDEDYIILAGRTRRKALLKLKRKETEVIVISGLSEEQKRKYRLLDNKTGELAEWNIEKLTAELEGLDFEGLNLDWGIIDPDDFGDDFSLASGDKSQFEQMSFTLASEQADLIRRAIAAVKDSVTETFGNENENGNALYEVVRQWAQRI